MSPIFLIGLLTLLTFIAFATYRTNQALKVWTPEENILLSPSENIARLILIALAVGLGFLSGEDVHTLGWQPLHPLGDVLIGILLGIAIPLSLYYPSRWVETHHPEWHSDIVVESIRPRYRGQWPWVILALLPVALMEELLFRSLLLGAFAPHVNIVYFVIGVSVVFGLLHLPQGEWGVVGVILVSLVLSVVFLWRESLLVVVIAHWLMNVIQLVLDAITRRREEEAPSD
ncbi:MAG TPA: CPBP family intramembrane metalloprotease [Anaerolineae bacterium]|nr:CPBP family intramembrane metalloprotease [Caldilineae bacterium]HID33995.1 CPBP family intramembrane metalloprotease [Anaerolineae bacterium]HIQ12611.1 CPBP family intramembrane metalloprotease [Caldilineales bacterium]